MRGGLQEEEEEEEDEEEVWAQEEGDGAPKTSTDMRSH